MFILVSTQRHFWPRLGFAIEKGVNKLEAIPQPAQRKIEQLMAAGIVSMPGAARSGSLRGANVVAQRPSRLGNGNTSVPPEPPPPRPRSPDRPNAALPPEDEVTADGETVGESSEQPEGADGEATVAGESEIEDDSPEQPAGETEGDGADGDTARAPTADDAKAVLEAGSARIKRHNRR